MTSSDSGIDELAQIARDVALDAADLALRRRREGVSVAATKSTPIDVVTHADRETEELIRGTLQRIRPGDSFFGEESGGGAGSSGLTWVVDPIDGTVNYLYGIPSWAVSVAVVEGDPDPATWRALAGAVVNPVSGEVYTAAAGRGAALNGTPLTAAPEVELEQALVATGFAYRMEPREEQIALVSALLRRARDIRRAGAASLDLCAVAAGRVNAYYERGLQPWDMAAGALIAAEAGATVAGFDGGAATTDGLIAGPVGLVRSLSELIAEVRSPNA